MEHWHELAVGVGALVVSAFIIMASRWLLHIRDVVNSVDDSVNHRHQRSDEGGAPLKLYDVVLENRRDIRVGFANNERDHGAILEAQRRADERLDRRIDRLTDDCDDD